jgi:hypothetical protein
LKYSTSWFSGFSHLIPLAELVTLSKFAILLNRIPSIMKSWNWNLLGKHPCQKFYVLYYSFISLVLKTQYAYLNLKQDYGRVHCGWQS